MNLNHLKKFAQGARRKLMAEVAARLDYLLGHDDAYIRANEAHVTEIRSRLDEKGREQLVEEVAYTWFNRIVALRFMDLRGYTKVRIVSPQTGQVQPELLYQIKQGRTPKALHSLQETFDAYLTCRIRTDQPYREIYTAALLGMCNDHTETLPFLFRRVDEYMAVLLPTDLLSENSILADVQNAITEEEVEDVEVIGWLYQFYISEKKDQVFARPKGEKIKKEDIPAATQLFTPHWIVRYMVENSLGRLWRNNFPDTRVSEQMDYYIEGDPEPDYLKISGPEEITLLDPACGSGHILTYAFDLLYAMYEEAGYTPSEIPSLILQNNLYGIDIDPRAAELAAFALTMKARERDRFFFQREVEPNVIAMEDVEVDLPSASAVMSEQLNEVFGCLPQATNYGSLIPVPSEAQAEIMNLLSGLEIEGKEGLFDDYALSQVRSGLRQLSYLAQRYHCVVTNPPYMATVNANQRLKDLVAGHYIKGKPDLFAAFILRGMEMLSEKGYLGIITQHAWMFLQSFEHLRSHLLSCSHIVNMVHLGTNAFSTIGGEVVQTASFVCQKGNTSAVGIFVRLVDVSGPGKRDSLRDPAVRFEASSEVFTRIPGSPITYWASSAMLRAFEFNPAFSRVVDFRQGLITGDNERFVRIWFEVARSKFQRPSASDHKRNEPKNAHKWFGFNKGGVFRRWYGNLEYVVDWANNGESIRNHVGQDGKQLSRPQNTDYYFRSGLTWTKITSGSPAGRYVPAGHIFSDAGMMGFSRHGTRELAVTAAFNSNAFAGLFSLVCSAVNFSIGDIQKVPYPESDPDPNALHVAQRLLTRSKADWDSRETSWDFRRSPLLTDYAGQSTQVKVDENLTDIYWPSRLDLRLSIAEAYQTFTRHWSGEFTECHRLEEQNNRIFIDLYGLQDELSPEVPYSEVTILQDELDKDARERGEMVFNKKEVLRQFVSYGVGCIFGRYSLDEDGLILANAGDTIDTYLERIPDPRLRPDESGILPITEDDDFPDDLPSQFRAFLRAAFGTEQYDENLQFLEEGLGRDLRSYFLKEFYKDHVKRYKKRPIYWLITSPKGSLRALIYLHRYNRDTVNRFLNDYLRPYQRKLEARRRTAEQSLNTGGLSGSERTKARKEIDRISAALDELSVWERDVVRPLAEQRVELDLDDGVKVNYGKLGAILETVKGLNG